MIESRGWLLLALIFTVLLVLLNLSSIEDRAPSPLLGKAAEDKFDYAMKNMLSQQFDEQGNLVSTLTADNLFHYPQQQIIQLENPALDFKISEQRWTLNANSGSLSEISEELTLGDVVTITNPAESETGTIKENSNNITIEINELIFNMREQLAFSQNSVTLISDNWQVKGDGLAIDIEKQTLEILNNVEAVHETR